MNVKVLLVASTQGDYGGIEAFVIAIANSINRWPGFEAKICFKRVKNYDTNTLKNKLAHAEKSSIVFVERNSSELREEIAKADILHVQNLCPDAIFAAYFQRKPILATIHNYCRRSHSLHNIAWRISRSMVSRRFYNSDFVWNSWEPGKRHRHSERVPTVSELPILFTPFEQRKGFLFIGRWIDNKGIEQLVDAYSLATLDRAEWPLTIIGDGPLSSKIHQMIANLKMQENILTPGFVDRSTKDIALSTCKWLVAPAKTNEDMGLTPIEARAVKVGVIATRDGGLPESAGPSAFIVSPGNVEELSVALEKATNISPADYERRCIQGFESLTGYLRPIDYYRDTYFQLLR